MTIDVLNKDKVKEAIAIYDEAFGKIAAEKLEGFFVSDPGNLPFCHVLSEGEQIVSLQNELPAKLLIRDNLCPAKLFSYIATRPTFRGKGYAKELFINGLNTCKKESIPLIAFDTSSVSRYKKWGCSIGFDAYILQVSTELLFNTPISKENLTGQLMPIEKIMDLRRTFGRVRSYNHIYLPESWERVWSYDGTESLYVLRDGGEVVGYMRYKVSSQKMLVAEIRYLSYKVLLLLRDFISSQGQVKVVKFTNLPPDFPIDEFVRDYWSDSEEVIFSYMSYRTVRIVDVKRAIELAASRNTEVTSVSLRVNDDLIGENNGVYRILGKEVVKNGEVTEETMFIDVLELVNLLTGRKSAVEIAENGKITDRYGNSIIEYNSSRVPCQLECLEKVFPKVTTYSIEEY
jgi:predicted acetyltransferase